MCVCAQEVHAAYVISMPNRALHYYHRSVDTHTVVCGLSPPRFANKCAAAEIPIYGSGFRQSKLAHLVVSLSLSALCFSLARLAAIMLIIRFRCAACPEWLMANYWLFQFNLFPLWCAPLSLRRPQIYIQMGRALDWIQSFEFVRDRGNKSLDCF